MSSSDQATERAEFLRCIGSPLTQAEISIVRSRIATLLCNLGDFVLYWYPPERRVMGRSVYCHRTFSVPGTAVRIGVYSDNGRLQAAQIVQDVLDAIAVLEQHPTERPAC